MKYRNQRSFAELMDNNDVLHEYRSRFHLPPGHKHRSQSIYLCGHSLGLQPKLARDKINAELDYWEQLGVKGHFDAPTPWMSYHESLTQSMATLVGALPQEVVVMNSLTVNLHLMMVSFFQPREERCKILIEAHAFPSDRYAVVSQLQHHGLDPEHDLIEVQPAPDEDRVSTERLLAAIETHGDDVALVLLGGVSYFSGQVLDMRALVRAAHEKGCLIGIDLAHAAGNMVLKLHDWNVDFAVWCTYKYLNGGPGSVGACFVHERHGQASLNRFAGWWGHDKATRFKMPPDFSPIPGAEGWQLSNPPVLALAALRASMEVFDEVGMEALRTKSKLLTGYLAFLFEKQSAIRVITPKEPSERGCQLSLQIAGADRSLYEYLMAKDVICDWREPNIIRMAPVPLYNTFSEVYDAAEELSTGLSTLGITAPQ